MCAKRKGMVACLLFESVLKSRLTRLLPMKGLFRGKVPHEMDLAICSKSGDILEPMITPQWYIRCEGMAEKAKEVLRNGSLKIIPAEHDHTWFQWLDNIRDWCVSRQLWWGHQIPAWFATTRFEVLDKDDMACNDRWIVARSEQVSSKVRECTQRRCPNEC
jgi:valyl-tRNA synthetase